MCSEFWWPTIRTLTSFTNPLALTYPDGKMVHYDYDAADQLVKVTDWAGRVTGYEYDKNGRLISETRPNGTQMSRRYNVAGQLVQQVEKDNPGELINQFDFSYDAAGNILKEQKLPKPESVSLPPVTMTYSAANRLATYNGQAVQFDADGNLVSGPLSGEMANFRFDSRNRLVAAGETSYRYDAENQRIGVNQSSYVVNSQPALSQVLVKEENGVKTFYVYGLGLIGEEKDGEYRSYHFDFRGSTVAITDQTGKVVERFQYGPYGELLKGEASVTPFLFNGKFGVMTEGNGLYYMRARFYSAEMKRFVNLDVLLGNITEGQTLNRYAFVTGRPVSLVDPFGLEGVLDEHGNPGTGSASVLDPGMTFNPSFWDQGYIRVVTNCYAYALNRPGFHGNPGDQTYILPFLRPTCENLMSGTKKDGLIASQDDIAGSCGGKCPKGYHKIQIFLDPRWFNPDFHVFRQDENGWWSHKAGKGGYIDNLDAKGEKILCPINQSRNNIPYGGRNYPDYCGTLCAPNY